MNVNDFDRYISSYLDGDLNSSKVKEFEKLLDENPELNEKFSSYKKMLNELSNLETIKTSDDFLSRLHEKIDNNKTPDYSFIKPKTIFGYNYTVVSGIAAAIGIFMFSISTFLTSDSLPSFNLNQLSSKDVQGKTAPNISSDNLIAEDDSSTENEEIDLPKIHLVGGKK